MEPPPEIAIPQAQADQNYQVVLKNIPLEFTDLKEMIDDERAYKIIATENHRYALEIFA